MLALSLALSLAVAPPPQKPAKRPQHILVWSGATTRAAAESQQSAAALFFELLGEYLEFEPAVVESAKIKGLKPGFFVVALGVCAKPDDNLKLFQSVRPPVYAKPVEFKPQGDGTLPCPSPRSVEQGAWALDGVERVVLGKRRLVGLTFSYAWQEEGDFAREYYATSALIALLDDKGGVVRAEEIQPPGDASRGTLSRVGDGLVFDVEFADPPCEPSTDRFASYRQRTTVRVKGETLVIDAPEPKLLREGGCGFAAESEMITGGPPKP